MKKLFALLLVLALTLSCAAMAEQKCAAYLSDYYGIEDLGDTVTLDQFNAALTAMGGEAIEGDTLTMEAAAVAAVKLAGMNSLALTYINSAVPDKADVTLAEYTQTCAVEEDKPYIACALDLGLIFSSDDLSGEVSGEDAARLLYNAAEIAGKGRHYIGRVSDNDILAKIRTATSAMTMFDEETLTNLGVEIVMRGATTGYGLKYEGSNANFLPEYSIKYGHSDYDHAVELIALLNSENIDAYIQIEPKVSVYEYLIDWGEPGEPTATYAVREVSEGRYLAYATEYDMMLEFDTTEDRERFHELIETYSKKNDNNVVDGQVTEYLLDGAWWQPLYSSTCEFENENFKKLVDNVIYSADGSYSIHSFSMPENAEAVAAVVAEVAPELSVSTVEINVNPAFYNYISGEDYQ